MGGLTMWTEFLVVYTGMIFGQAYRTIGLLRVLLDSVESIVPGARQGRPRHCAGGRVARCTFARCAWGLRSDAMP